LSSELLTGHTANSDPDDDDSFSDRLGLSIQKASSGQNVTEFTAVQPTPLAHGVLTIDVQSGARIQSTLPELATLFGDRNGAVVSMMPVGKGRLIVIADDAFASNRGLGSSENAVFIGNLLGRYAKPGTTVAPTLITEAQLEAKNGAGGRTPATPIDAGAGAGAPTK